MSDQPLSGLFICEGSSDQPLAGIVETLFSERGRYLRLSHPDFARLTSVGRDVRSKLVAGAYLMDAPFDLAVVHRDADGQGWDNRRDEIHRAVEQTELNCGVIPIIPIRMTEAWLLLDEQKIREVAQNPNGRENLDLPKPHEVESIADPKTLLSDCLLRAASARGRRRNVISKRYSQHRRQLLEGLDPHGPVTQLTSWRKLLADIDRLAESLDGA